LFGRFREEEEDNYSEIESRDNVCDNVKSADVILFSLSQEKTRKTGW